MGNYQSNYASLVQTAENNIALSAVNESNNSCQNIDSGSNVIIDIGDIVGDINLVQLCTITGSNVIDNSVDIQVQNILDALQKQKQTTDTFVFQTPVNIQLNRAEISQMIRNNIVQTAVNSCNSNVSNIRNGSSYVVKGGSLKGNVNFIQKGDVSSDCFIKNLSSITAFNQLKAQQSQDQSITVGFGNYLIIIAIVVAVVVIGIILFFFFTNKPQQGGAGANNVKVLDTRAQQPPQQIPNKPRQ